MRGRMVRARKSRADEACDSGRLLGCASGVVMDACVARRPSSSNRVEKQPVPSTVRCAANPGDKRMLDPWGRLRYLAAPPGRQRPGLPLVGAWLSLVERCVRDAKVGGSNPLAPTSFLADRGSGFGRSRSAVAGSRSQWCQSPGCQRSPGCQPHRALERALPCLRAFRGPGARRSASRLSGGGCGQLLRPPSAPAGRP